MRPAIAAFAAHVLPNLAGCRVVEVGSLNLNGSIRPTIEVKGAGEYIGIDMIAGPGVTLVGDACELSALVGAESAGLVVSVDTLEHVDDWRSAVSEMKLTCVPGGMILLAAAPVGFQRHNHPGDYWRVSAEYLRAMFTDCEELAMNEALPAILVRKPLIFTMHPLWGIDLPEVPK